MFTCFTLWTPIKSTIDFKGEKIPNFSNLSLITLAKQHTPRPITLHLKKKTLHAISLGGGFPFRSTVTKFGSQQPVRDPRKRGLPLRCWDWSEEALSIPLPRPHLTKTPRKIWTLAKPKNRQQSQALQHTTPPQQPTWFPVVRTVNYNYVLV